MMGVAMLLVYLAADPPSVIPCGEVPDDMACVPGGWFTSGHDEDTHRCTQRFGKKKRRPNAKPARRVWLQTFLIDRHEVTFSEYEACIAAKACTPRPEDGRWGPRYTDFSRPNQPITGANWFQAREYCRSKGKELPSEAQWEKAARGSDGEATPWGDAPVNCERAVIKDAKGRSCGIKKRGSQATGRVLAVGSRTAGRYGIFDLVGNVEEWVADWYTDDYAVCGEACSGIEPRGPCAGDDRCPGHTLKVVKGGSWYWDRSHATSWHRRPHFPDNRAPKRFHHFGFRCAKRLESHAAIDALPAKSSRSSETSPQ